MLLARSRLRRPTASKTHDCRGEAATLHKVEHLSTTLKTYDRVKIAAIRGDRFAALPIFYSRHPEVGDVAYIVHTHQAEHAYEVECSDPSSGETLWLDAMYIDELVAWPE